MSKEEPAGAPELIESMDEPHMFLAQLIRREIRGQSNARTQKLAANGYLFFEVELAGKLTELLEEVSLGNWSRVVTCTEVFMEALIRDLHGDDSEEFDRFSPATSSEVVGEESSFLALMVLDDSYKNFVAALRELRESGFDSLTENLEKENELLAHVLPELKVWMSSMGENDRIVVTWRGGQALSGLIKGVSSQNLSFALYWAAVLVRQLQFQPSRGEAS